MSLTRISAIDEFMGGDAIAAAGFPAIARTDARILILGSLPSERSLGANQYYAHPQNAFWTIMGEIAGAKGTYSEQCEALMDRGIALWDVLASSVRPGSMDADIQSETAVANDFAAFLKAHDGVELVCFNGQKAAQLFARMVQPGLEGNELRFASLPSTSPAYASMSYVDKLAKWRSIIV
jgi:hypoxanthine-DNA glycosylase